MVLPSYEETEDQVSHEYLFKHILSTEIGKTKYIVDRFHYSASFLVKDPDEVTIPDYCLWTLPIPEDAFKFIDKEDDVTIFSCALGPDVIYYPKNLFPKPIVITGAIICYFVNSPHNAFNIKKRFYLKISLFENDKLRDKFLTSFGKYFAFAYIGYIIYITEPNEGKVPFKIVTEYSIDGKEYKECLIYQPEIIFTDKLISKYVDLYRDFWYDPIIRPDKVFEIRSFKEQIILKYILENAAGCPYDERTYVFGIGLLMPIFSGEALYKASSPPWRLYEPIPHVFRYFIELKRTVIKTGSLVYTYRRKCLYVYDSATNSWKVGDIAYRLQEPCDCEIYSYTKLSKNIIKPGDDIKISIKLLILPSILKEEKIDDTLSIYLITEEFSILIKNMSIRFNYSEYKKELEIFLHVPDLQLSPGEYDGYIVVYSKNFGILSKEKIKYIQIAKPKIPISIEPIIGIGTLF